MSDVLRRDIGVKKGGETYAGGDEMSCKRERRRLCNALRGEDRGGDTTFSSCRSWMPEQNRRTEAFPMTAPSLRQSSAECPNREGDVQRAAAQEAWDESRSGRVRQGSPFGRRNKSSVMTRLRLWDGPGRFGRSKCPRRLDL